MTTSADIEVREVADREFEIQRGWSEFILAETTGGERERRLLLAGVDAPDDDDELSDEVLLALAEPRRVALAALMARYRIVSGPDYQYEDDYALLYSTAPVGRYAAVTGDETYHWIHVVDTVQDGLDSLASDVENQYGNEYPHHPVELHDLDTGRSIGFRVRAVVELAD